jgi:hypothetical protein
VTHLGKIYALILKLDYVYVNIYIFVCIHIYIYAWYQEPGKTADMDGPEIMLMGREQEITAKEDSTIDEQAGN